MPRELDDSFRWRWSSSAEVESAGPDHSPKYNCHLVHSAIHQNFFMAAFHRLSWGLATDFTAVQPIVNLILFS